LKYAKSAISDDQTYIFFYLLTKTRQSTFVEVRVKDMA